MAAPYRLDEYLPSVLMRDLVSHDRSPSAFLLYFYLAWRSSNERGGKLEISLHELATATGLSKRTLQESRRLLERRKLIAVSRGAPTATPVYQVLKPWIRSVRS